MKSAQIVLIEDNPADVLLVGKALEENRIQHSLTRFGSGEEAIRVLCAASRKEALHRLKEFPRLSEVPIAILTSSRDRKRKHRAAIQGTRYIEKPSQLNEFLTSVGQAVKEMLGVSPPEKS